jgi:hypothetical protein
MIAMTCGTPTPATTRVVQIASAPASASAGARVRRHVAADDVRTMSSTAPVAVGGVHDDPVDARVDQRPGALVRVAADTDRGGDPRAALRVLGGQRVLLLPPRRRSEATERAAAT